MEIPQGRETAPGGAEKQILERFIYNVMLMASQDGFDKMLTMAKSAKNGPQALARALLFIVKAVKTGLEKKGVQVPGNMYLAENGILSQSARVVAALLLKNGVQFQPDDVAQAIEMVATQLAIDFDKQQAGNEQGEQAQGQPQQAQQPQPEQAAPPQQANGLLAQAQGGM